MSRNAEDVRNFISSIPNTILDWLNQKSNRSTGPVRSDEIILKGEKDLADNYRKLFQSIADAEKKLANLDETRGDIAAERYEALKDEYTSFLNTAKPKLADILKEIDNKIEIWVKDDEAIVEELTETQKAIRQEDRLFEAGAISREEHQGKTAPLKSKSKELNSKHNKKQSQIRILIAAKNHQPPPAPPPGSHGGDPPGTPPKFYKNPAHATVLSFFWMGLGQIYNDQLLKGIGFMILYSFSAILISIYVGLITTPALWIWGMVDANKTAKAINGKVHLGQF
ncbi:MAG: hypothetical protein P1P89_21960 [Desulfobacterales bacterium]|nr:hypothetical protein [Desulfobacterales bacterium]